MADSLTDAAELRFVNARVVTSNEVITGGVVVSNGRIRAVDTAPHTTGAVEDVEGDFLIPGLIDIHTDNLERHYQPRPGAHWDPLGAALAHDGQMASAGVTTVFDSLSLHGLKDGLDRSAALRPMIDGVERAGSEGLLRAQHFLHLRCEVTNPHLVTVLNSLIDEPALKLLSVMDHSPGQRQMRHLTPESLRQMLREDGRTEAEIEEIASSYLGGQVAAMVGSNRKAVIDIAAARNLPLASHDDESPEHVIEAAAEGATISEFPVSVEAAREARARGLSVFMGAPNLVRGSSHSGNVSARDIAAAGLLDGLASDYVPLSMLRAAFLLTEAPFNFEMSAAIATVTLAPAKAVRLDDRGEIAAGKRADLVRVARSREGWPIVRGVWREGRRVA
jgi:alpha-D-ribose 1-methylphosphonate 5-triphosphate diphosphatase